MRAVFLLIFRGIAYNLIGIPRHSGGMTDPFKISTKIFFHCNGNLIYQLFLFFG